MPILRSSTPNDRHGLEAIGNDEDVRLEALRKDIAEGLADAAAGRTVDAEEVFDRLIAKYKARQ